MTSRSATVLVIFIIAIFAFCFASVFAVMTGPISILPNETESGGILDNLSALTDDIDDSSNSYGYQDYSHSDYSYSDDSDNSHVETTTDDSPSSQSTDSDIETTTDDSSSGNHNGGDSNKGKSSSSSDVETTKDTN